MAKCSQCNKQVEDVVYYTYYGTNIFCSAECSFEYMKDRDGDNGVCDDIDK